MGHPEVKFRLEQIKWFQEKNSFKIIKLLHYQMCMNVLRGDLYNWVSVWG